MPGLGISIDHKQEVAMRNLIPARFYTYDFTRLVAIIAITLAIAVIVYSVLFGRIL
ncbi:hypothetical protein BMJ34_11950 [Sinorhizobium medicae]|uniref:Transmembrane protein n=2 Tax=Sinorhizobium medicae TaxID=110321 RepID=A0ABX4TT25_9HYPH|nr:hypothetical protein [Sinorhizobium medicae]MDX0633573.1 hypothetical protein [Sinorhizobium medicae]MDX0694565.1 hypothetical protein [Sinorhizobium medicae]MDX0743748.1 hypothetical protein [Sinorhizobium medicae]MDX0771754.1 hypothetical protein [Sinorhizobium medicae]